ncbi:MAG: hypothetical protein IAG10_09660 [Planctomycetaceae bacterium]|nr:hypothetical protein [Planctomycetaceae bacterium]
MTIEQSPAAPTSSRGNGAMICGCLLGLVSAVALAVGGNMCESILEVLFFRPSPGANSGGNPFDLGTRLLRVSWAPVGVAAGTAMTLVGLQQSMRRTGRPATANVLVLLSAIIAGLGAFEIKSGIRQTQYTILVATNSTANSRAISRAISRPVEAEPEATPVEAEPEATQAPPGDALARGWLLLAIAQVMLTAASIAQAKTRIPNPTTARDRSKEDLAVIVLMGLFGVIISWSWFSNGLAIERTLGQKKSIIASEFVAQVNHVLSSTDWGAWALLASMTVLVFTTGMDSSRHPSSSVSRTPS